MQLLLIIGAVFAISWVVSTPEDRAAAKPMADSIGKALLALEAIVIAVVWLLGRSR